MASDRGSIGRNIAKRCLPRVGLGRRTTSADTAPSVAPPVHTPAAMAARRLPYSLMGAAARLPLAAV